MTTWGPAEDSQAIRFILSNRVQYDLPEIVRDAQFRFRHVDPKVLENRITWWYYYYYGEDQKAVEKDLEEILVQPQVEA